MQTMSPEQLKTLDQMRQRLSQLSTSIQTLHSELERTQPLPTWPSLQSSAQLLSYNLQQLGDLLAAQQTFLRAAHAYPLPSFPGHTHPFILETLLSKKLPSRTEEWIDDFTTEADGDSNVKRALRAERNDLVELWNWAGPAESQVVRQMLEEDDFEDDYTLAEREAGIETVVTGLRRLLDADEARSDAAGAGEGDDAPMQDVPGSDATTAHGGGAGAAIHAPALPLESVLRFLSTGDVNAHVSPPR